MTDEQKHPAWVTKIGPRHARVMEQMRLCPVCGKEMIEPEGSGSVTPLIRSKQCPRDHVSFVWGIDRMGYASLVVMTDDLAELD